jgi:hypothetical protein
MLGWRGLQRGWHIAAALVQRRLQRAAEIDIACLVVGRITIGDIRGQHGLALRAQAQCGFVEPQIIVELS